MTQEATFYTDSKVYGLVDDNHILQQVKAKFAAAGATLDSAIGGEIKSDMRSWRTLDTNIHLAADAADIKEAISTLWLHNFSGNDGYYYHVIGKYFIIGNGSNSEEILRICVIRWTALAA